MIASSIHIKIGLKEFKVYTGKDDVYLIVSSYSKVDANYQIMVLGYNVSFEHNRLKWEMNDASKLYENDRNIDNEIMIERFLNNHTYEELKSILISTTSIKKYKL